MNLSLTPELEQLIQSKIETGMYTNASEVVRDALRRMDDNDIWQELRQFLEPRIKAVEKGEIITQSFDSIIEEAKNS